MTIYWCNAYIDDRYCMNTARWWASGRMSCHEHKDTFYAHIKDWEWELIRYREVIVRP